MKNGIGTTSICGKLQTLSILLTGLAGFAAQCAVDAALPLIWNVVITVAACGLIVAFASFPMPGRSPHVHKLAHLALGAAVLFPLVQYAMGWVQGGHPSPLEIPLMAMCRNALFGMAAIATDQRAWKRLVALSAFVITIAIVRLEYVLALSVLAVYVAVGCAWLPIAYGHAHSLSIPTTAITGLLVGVAMLATAAMSDSRVSASLRGFLPSSGGTGAGNENAASGLGDGPDEVAGSEHVKSIGFDQSEIFMNSTKSGLYDAFIESSGAPLDHKMSAEKLQMLRAKDLKMSSAADVEDFRAGLRFTLDRKAPSSSAVATSHDAPALLYVDGDLPVHLRTNAFASFDGTEWSQDKAGWPGHVFHDLPSPEKWFEVDDRLADPGGSGERTYRVRVGSLLSDSLPLPALSTRFHLGRAVRSLLLKWEAPDVLRMNRQSVPPGTVLDVKCEVFDPTRLPAAGWTHTPPATQATDPRIAELARQWTANVSAGWPQVQTIITGLQNRCQLNRSYRPSESCVDRINEFLFTSRQGPDYLFASSAAVMLRSLGYTTRLASGFYAGPNDFDSQKKQAVLNAINTHFWTEVMLPTGRWAIVEATPGYAVRGPEIPLTTRMAKAVRAWLAADWGWGLTGLSLLITSFAYRLRLIDLASAFFLWIWPGSASALHVRRAFWWIEFRARCADSARPGMTTPAKWLRAIKCHNDFAELVSWACYAPSQAIDSRWSMAEVRSLCQTATRQLTASRIRNHGRKIL